MGFDLNEYTLYGEIEDASTASSTFVVAPFGGEIIAIYTALQGAIITADAAITFEIGGVAITGSAITVTQVGSAAGDVDSSFPTALNRIEAGQTIEMITSGASGNAVKLPVTIIIAR